MRRRPRWLPAAVLALAIAPAVSGCGSAAPATLAPSLPPSARPSPTAAPSPTATATPSPTPAPSAASYAGTGPFATMTESIAIGTGPDALDVALAYPATGSAPDVAHGPYPLVVFSVGLGGSASDVVDALDHMASHGFVAASWTPRGESGIDFWAGAATRPLDLRGLLDGLGALSAPGGRLAGLIAIDRVAVVGHSSGGWTALEAGGARMDLDFCDHADLVARLGYSNCPQFTAHRDDIATMLGLPSAPDGLWPATADPRVRAVIALAPDGDLWGAGYEGIAGVSVPTMVVAGSADDVNVPELCALAIYAHLTTDRTLVVLDGAGHDMGGDRYGAVLRHLVVAFLLAHLEADPAAVEALRPSNVTVDGVRYETAPGS